MVYKYKKNNYALKGVNVPGVIYERKNLTGHLPVYDKSKQEFMDASLIEKMY